MPPFSKPHHRPIPTDLLDDLCSRFIVNLPQPDRGDLVRICFQIELAHWFYLDFYCPTHATLYPCRFQAFARQVFEHVPYLREHIENIEEILYTWRRYKISVPTYGAIILDSSLTHVLLVQSFWSKASWSCPKGKVNENEQPWECAAREVLEETGFDITNLINKDDYVETTINEQFVRLYMVPYVSSNIRFQPKTKNEIKSCRWFPLAYLPHNKRDRTPRITMGVSPNAFFMVQPFMTYIERWIAEKTTNINGRWFGNYPNYEMNNVQHFQPNIEFLRAHQTYNPHIYPRYQYQNNNITLYRYNPYHQHSYYNNTGHYSYYVPHVNYSQNHLNSMPKNIKPVNGRHKSVLYKNNAHTSLVYLKLHKQKPTCSTVKTKNESLKKDIFMSDTLNKLSLAND